MRSVPKLTLGQGDHAATPFSLIAWKPDGTAELGVEIVVDAPDTAVIRLNMQTVATIRRKWVNVLLRGGNG
jgi:hypothetical protein